MAGRRVRDVHLVRSGGKRSLGVADLLLQRLAHEQAGLASVRLGGGERDDRALLFISDADQGLRMLGLLLRLGEHNGDRLAVPVDAVILHDRQVVGTGRLGLAHERRRSIELWGVAMRHHQNDARRRFGRMRVDLDDAAARDRRVFERRVGQPLHRELGAKLRLARNLQRAVNARNRGADQAMLMMHQRVGVAAGNPAVGRKRDSFLHHRLDGVLHNAHCAAPWALASLPRVSAITRVASSILKALSRKGSSRGELRLGRLTEGGLRRRAAPKRGFRALRAPRLVGHAAERDAHVLDHAALHLEAGGHRDKGEGVRGAIAHLAIGRAGGDPVRRQRHRNDELARLEHGVDLRRVARQAVERGQRNVARSVLPPHRDDGVQEPQGRRTCRRDAWRRSSRRRRARRDCD